MRGDRRLLCVALGGAAIALTAGCASSGAVPRPFPVPGGEAPVATPTVPPATRGAPGVSATPLPWPDGYTLSSTALALRGAPYRNGGSTPEGFDCSGFVKYVFGLHGVGVPRATREQFRLGRSIERKHLAPGDLVFFS